MWPRGGGDAALLTLDKLEVDGVPFPCEDQRQGRRRGRSPVFDAQLQPITAPLHDHQGIGPGVEVDAATQGEAGVATRAVLARVVDDADGGVVIALELTQLVEDLGDLTRVALVDAVHPDQGVEQQERRPMSSDGGPQASTGRAADRAAGTER